MKDTDCVEFLQWALPRLHMRWPGFRKVRRQVCRRVARRFGELGLPHVRAYRAYLEAHPAEWKALDAFCRISISRFYRDRGVFDFLRQVVLPELGAAAKAHGQDALRAWIAGCASGEEVYTLNVIWRLDHQKRFPDVRLHLLATDADHAMLDRARRAVYPRSSLKDLPSQWIDAAFIPDNDEFRLRDEFREDVTFREQDIRRSMPDGPFQMIGCRHLVFTYFDESLQRKLLDQMIERLAPGGVLMTGKQESLPHGVELIEPCQPRTGIYRKPWAMVAN